MTIKINPAHVAADILCAALPGGLDPELSDAYLYGPRGGVHGVDHNRSGTDVGRKPALAQALAWRADRIHHGETLSYAPGGPGRYARYGSGYRLPGTPTARTIYAAWTPAARRQVESGQISTVVDGIIEALEANDPADRKAIAALRKLSREFHRWERAGAFQADDPQTNPARLAALAERTDLRWLRRPVLRALAANPSTPAGTLLPVLAELSDVDVASLDLAIQPGATRDEALLSLAARPGLPEALVDQIVRGAAPSPEALLELARHQRSPVLVRMAGDHHIAPELMSAFSVNPSLRAVVAGNPYAPAEVLLAMASPDVDPNVGERLVRLGLNTPPEVLAALANAEQSRVRAAVAGSYYTPPEVLAALAADDDASVRAAVAGNSHTPPEVLAALANDPSDSVRAAVAGNSRTPPEALAELAADSSDRVRAAVARNQHTPSSALAVLARDEDSSVRIPAASNPATPPEALAALARDEDNEVRRYARRNPSTSAAVA